MGAADLGPSLSGRATTGSSSSCGCRASEPVIAWARRGGVIGQRLALARFLVFRSALLRSNDSWLFTIGNAVEGLGVMDLRAQPTTSPP